jgi:hypothetical protein
MGVEVYLFRRPPWVPEVQFDADVDLVFAAQADIWLATARKPSRRIGRRKFRYPE